MTRKKDFPKLESNLLELLDACVMLWYHRESEQKLTLGG
jgi:hypothetical protein